MGALRGTDDALLIAAVTARRDEAFQWARARAERAWGPVALASPPFEFVETDYYLAEMGPELKKQLWAFDNLIDPSSIPQAKRRSNVWEHEYADQRDDGPQRPLNIDPGYVTLAKLVLASTKDHAHRIYVGRGIFAEVTLNYRQRGWQPLPWTYPDYRRADYQQFLTSARELLRQKLTRRRAARYY